MCIYWRVLKQDEEDKDWGAKCVTLSDHLKSSRDEGISYFRSRIWGQHSQTFDFHLQPPVVRIILPNIMADVTNNAKMIMKAWTPPHSSEASGAWISLTFSNGDWLLIKNVDVWTFSRFTLFFQEQIDTNYSISNYGGFCHWKATLPFLLLSPTS